MKGIIKQILLATCVIGAPTCVYALPFNPNPQSFQSYANTVRWDDGSRISFQNLNNCEEKPDMKLYACNNGYATIANPMGTKVCDLKTVGWWDNKIIYETRTCRYK